MGITSKQLEVVKCFEIVRPKILVCSGAKRAGKTWILIYCFLRHIAEYENKGYSFILGGTNQASIRRNVLNDLEIIIGHEIKLSKDNHFKIFGNKIYCFDGANADSYKKVRGFTSYGAFLNEATTLHNTFIKEVISRCSGEGARIIMDTNPENPTHTVKVDYIDKSGQRLSNGRLNIKAFSFTLFDNTFLDKEYVESIIQSTPSGMFTDRDIYGKWVSAEGVIYPDFAEDLFIDVSNVNYDKVFCGVDWGFEHYGCIVVIAVDKDENYYLLEENAYQHKDIEFWVSEGMRIKAKYGDVMFYSDSARPEYIVKFQSKGLKAINANKSVLEGITEVATLFKKKKFFINREVKRFREEIYNYVWKPNADEPVKIMDDVMDGIRYAIHSENTMSNDKYDKSIYEKGKGIVKPNPYKRRNTVF